MQINNTVQNMVLQNKKNELRVKCKYSFSSSTVVGTDLKQIKQASNDATRAYKENQVTLQYIWMFWIRFEIKNAIHYLKKEEVPVIGHLIRMAAIFSICSMEYAKFFRAAFRNGEDY